jgi:hypothetical protein
MTVRGIWILAKLSDIYLNRGWSFIFPKSKEWKKVNFSQDAPNNITNEEIDKLRYEERFHHPHPQLQRKCIGLHYLPKKSEIRTLRKSPQETAKNHQNRHC